MWRLLELSHPLAKNFNVEHFCRQSEERSTEYMRSTYIVQGINLLGLVSHFFRAWPTECPIYYLMNDVWDVLEDPNHQGEENSIYAFFYNVHDYKRPNQMQRPRPETL